jgi:hypothetical protein
MEPTSQLHARAIADHLPLDDLGLSVRIRNALKSVGCSSIGDVLRLDLDQPVRGLGKLAKEELLAKLESAGFTHPAAAQPAAEITRLDRTLERLEHRIDSALGALSKEIRAARHRLRRLRLRDPQDPLSPANGSAKAELPPLPLE